MGSFFADNSAAIGLTSDITEEAVDRTRLNRKPERTEFKLLKNVAIVGRRQYKMTVALMLFVEILEEYLRIEKIYP